MNKKEPPLEGGDPTATDEIGHSTAVSNRSQTTSETAYTNIISTHESFEDGFRVTVTLVGKPDDGSRRRWLEQMLFGRYRLGSMPDQPDDLDFPSGVEVPVVGAAA